MRQRRFGSFGRSAREAGFASTSSSLRAVSKIAWRRLTSRLIVAGPSSCSETKAATCLGRIAASGIAPKWATRRRRSRR